MDFFKQFNLKKLQLIAIVTLKFITEPGKDTFISKQVSIGMLERISYL